MTVAGFLLSAVGGYLVGLVGSSNQPLSGLTLSALVLSALVMLAIGAKGMTRRGRGAGRGQRGGLRVLGFGLADPGSQGRLPAGRHALEDAGGGDRRGGVLSLFLMLPIVALHEANLATGGIGGRALPAPQAGLMAQLAKGIVGGQMAWGLIAIGAAFGIALIMCGAQSPMLIAVGMYLPFSTVSAIFVGGVIKWALDRFTAGREAAERAQNRRERHAAGLRPDRRRSAHGDNSGGDLPGGHQLVHQSVDRLRRVAVLPGLGRMVVAAGLRRRGVGVDSNSAAVKGDRMKRVLWLALAAAAACAQPAPTAAQIAGRFTPNDLKADVSFLASDALEGRGTPSRGLDIAAEYIAAEFRRAGLEPAGDDGYFQTAAFNSVRPDPKGLELTLDIGGKTLTVDRTAMAVLRPGAAALTNAPVLRVSGNGRGSAGG